MYHMPLKRRGVVVAVMFSVYFKEWESICVYFRYQQNVSHLDYKKNQFVHIAEL